jgi:uncharacterized protein YbcI
LYKKETRTNFREPVILHIKSTIVINTIKNISNSFEKVLLSTKHTGNSTFTTRNSSIKITDNHLQNYRAGILIIFAKKALYFLGTDTYLRLIAGG